MGRSASVIIHEYVYVYMVSIETVGAGGDILVCCSEMGEIGLAGVWRPTPWRKERARNGAPLDWVVHTTNHGKSWPARSGSRPLFGEDVVNLLHDPFCPLNRSRDHGGGSRTLPGVE